MSVELNEQKLLSLLSPNRATSIKTLAQRLYVSEPTARRYVNSLAAEGRVIRTVSDVKNEDEIMLHVSDGSISATVSDVRKEKKNGKGK